MRYILIAWLIAALISAGLLLSALIVASRADDAMERQRGGEKDKHLEN